MLFYTQAKELDTNTEYYLELLSTGVGKPKEELAEFLKGPRYFRAQEAIDYGLADTILHSLDGSFKPKVSCMHAIPLSSLISMCSSPLMISSCGLGPDCAQLAKAQEMQQYNQVSVQQLSWEMANPIWMIVWFCYTKKPAFVYLDWEESSPWSLELDARWIVECCKL